jgi:phenylacetate-CoA ligase
MHITAEDIIVEIIDGNGSPVPAGSAGEIVVTHLATRDYPFIRYRTGDIGTLGGSSCSCGRGLTLLKEIQGRTTDFVIAADGTMMHGLALIYVLRNIEGVDAFKIVQESRTRTRVLVVGSQRFTTAAAAAIERGIKARLGESVEVSIERVADIPSERSGKFRYVVSHAVGQ